jgi:hypothetical protein
LLKVLEADDAHRSQGLKDCIATKVDTSPLTVGKPRVPDSTAEDLETMNNDVDQRHTVIITEEIEVLDEAKVIRRKDSVEFIQAEHDANQKQINNELTAANQCDVFRRSMNADVDQRNTVLGALHDIAKQAHDEKARTKGIIDIAATLESSIHNADSTKQSYLLPYHSDKDALFKCLAERAGWYTKIDHKYIESHAAPEAAFEAYIAKIAVAVCKQVVFDAGLCEWVPVGASARCTYKVRRDNIATKFDVTKTDVHGKEYEQNSEIAG